MKLRVLLKILVLFNLISPIGAYASWSNEDTERQIAFTVLSFIDYKQTQEIVKDPTRKESNFILGSNPAAQTVSIYFFCTTLGHYMVSKRLSDENRKLWQQIWLIIETGYVGHNYKVGIRIRF
jgi:hypothetical protein